jgi:peptidoglycan-associated lipoprotein
MKKSYQIMVFICSAASLLITGCQKNNGSMWDDHRSAGNFKTKNGKALWGNSNDLALAHGADDLLGPSNEDFIPLKEDDLKAQFIDGAIPQPKSSPGEPGSGLPGIDRFQDPASHLSSVFRNVYFNTDDHILRGREYLATIDDAASYLKAHPNTYIFIEGHCDERGPEAYNLSLGARRANYVRSLLVKKGVDLNQIHTISYGKEKPAMATHNAEAWAKNRRAQFKIFQKPGA